MNIPQITDTLRNIQSANFVHIGTEKIKVSDLCEQLADILDELSIENIKIKNTNKKLNSGVQLLLREFKNFEKVLGL